MGASAAETRQLPFGVRVARQGVVHVKVADWRILVSVEAPTSNVNIVLEKARQWIRHGDFTPSERVRYLNRLEGLTGTSDAMKWRVVSGNDNRPKRAILGIIGELGREIFGLSTESEVEELRGYIDQSIQQQQELFVNYKDLVAVVNKSAHAIRINSENIRSLEESLTAAVKNANAKLKMLEVFADLQQAAYLRNREEDRWAYAKMSLEGGVVTEEILPVKYLRQLLRRTGPYLPLEWYYRHATIIPKYAERERLVYLISIPIPGPRVYNQYHLQAIPVPLGNKTGLVQVTSPLAVDTTNGRAFSPKNCQGTDPLICDPVVIRDNDYACERELLAGGSDEKQCIIKLREGGELLATSEGSELLVSLPEKQEFQEHCEGQIARSKPLQPGAYAITVPGGCEIVLGPFRLAGVRVYSAGIQLNWGQINVSFSADEEWEDQLNVLPLKEPIEVRVNHLNDIAKIKPMPIPQWHERPSPAWHWVTSIVILGGVFVGLALLWKYSAFLKSMCFPKHVKGTRQTEGRLEQTAPRLENGNGAVVTVQPPARMYPIISEPVISTVSSNVPPATVSVSPVETPEQGVQRVFEQVLKGHPSPVAGALKAVP